MLGYIQSRKGTNKPGPIGLAVPFADFIKLVKKELNFPNFMNKIVYTFVPSLALCIPLFLWIVYPTPYEVLRVKYSLLWFLCVSAVGVYALLGAGWGRNRKYSILGAVRAVAQSVSYEVSLFIIIIHFILFFYYSLWINKSSVLSTFLFFAISILLVTCIAESNRSPFDFSEGESELVRGFNTEFSAISFVMIFLAEYMNIIFISALVSLLFNTTCIFDFYLFLLLWIVLYV